MAARSPRRPQLHRQLSQTTSSVPSSSSPLNPAPPRQYQPHPPPRLQPRHTVGGVGAEVSGVSGQQPKQAAADKAGSGSEQGIQATGTPPPTTTPSRAFSRNLQQPLQLPLLGTQPATRSPTGPTESRTRSPAHATSHPPHTSSPTAAQRLGEGSAATPTRSGSRINRMPYPAVVPDSSTSTVGPDSPAGVAEPSASGSAAITHQGGQQQVLMSTISSGVTGTPAAIRSRSNAPLMGALLRRHASSSTTQQSPSTSAHSPAPPPVFPTHGPSAAAAVSTSTASQPMPLTPSPPPSHLNSLPSFDTPSPPSDPRLSTPVDRPPACPRSPPAAATPRTHSNYNSSPIHSARSSAVVAMVGASEEPASPSPSAPSPPETPFDVHQFIEYHEQLLSATIADQEEQQRQWEAIGGRVADYPVDSLDEEQQQNLQQRRWELLEAAVPCTDQGPVGIVGRGIRAPVVNNLPSSERQGNQLTAGESNPRSDSEGAAASSSNYQSTSSPMHPYAGWSRRMASEDSYGQEAESDNEMESVSYSISYNPASGAGSYNTPSQWLQGQMQQQQLHQGSPIRSVGMSEEDRNSNQSNQTDFDYGLLRLAGRQQHLQQHLPQRGSPPYEPSPPEAPEPPNRSYYATVLGRSQFQSRQEDDEGSGNEHHYTGNNNERQQGDTFGYSDPSGSSGGIESDDEDNSACSRSDLLELDGARQFYNYAGDPDEEAYGSGPPMDPGYAYSYPAALCNGYGMDVGEDLGSAGSAYGHLGGDSAGYHQQEEEMLQPDCQAVQFAPPRRRPDQHSQNYHPQPGQQYSMGSRGESSDMHMLTPGDPRYPHQYQMQLPGQRVNDPYPRRLMPLEATSGLVPLNARPDSTASLNSSHVAHMRQPFQHWMSQHAARLMLPHSMRDVADLISGDAWRPGLNLGMHPPALPHPHGRHLLPGSEQAQAQQQHQQQQGLTPGLAGHPLYTPWRNPALSDAESSVSLSPSALGAFGKTASARRRTDLLPALGYKGVTPLEMFGGRLPSNAVQKLMRNDSFVDNLLSELEGVDPEAPCVKAVVCGLQGVFFPTVTNAEDL
eukprot:gene27588-7223_t